MAVNLVAGGPDGDRPHAPLRRAKDRRHLDPACLIAFSDDMAGASSRDEIASSAADSPRRWADRAARLPTRPALERTAIRYSK